MALDDATAALLAQLSMARPKPLPEMTPAEAREMSAAMRAQQGPGPEMAHVKNTRVKAAGGAVPVRVLLPAEHPRGVIVYYHGGGWVLGSIEDSDLLGRHLAQRTGCRPGQPAAADRRIHGVVLGSVRSGRRRA